MKYMLDTNTCIYVIRQKPLNVIERFKKVEISQVGISSITLSDLLYGVSKSSKPEQNQMALASLLHRWRYWHMAMKLLNIMAALEPF
jgi:tRNA(fMet)-specific endonuclease VapC